jgi:hypothetical protein
VNVTKSLCGVRKAAMYVTVQQARFDEKLGLESVRLGN